MLNDYSFDATKYFFLSKEILNYCRVVSCPVQVIMKNEKGGLADPNSDFLVEFEAPRNPSSLQVTLA
jgi:hypothetical protein